MNKEEGHKKHHYVPQCYQRRFSTDKEIIKYFDKDTQTLCFKAIADFCQIEYLYYLEQDEKPFSLEFDYFSKLIEDKLGSLLKEFDVIDGTKDAILFNKDKKKAVAKQIVLQYMRTPKYRDIKYHNETQAYLEHTCILLEKMGFYAEELSYYSDKREYHRRLLYDESEINEIVDELIDAHWDLWYTDKEEFYTSDNPVVIIERQDMPVTYCEAIKYFNDIYFPLNPNLLLHIGAKGATNMKRISAQIIGPEKVIGINNIIKNKAPHYIIYNNRYY